MCKTKSGFVSLATCNVAFEVLDGGALLFDDFLY
jgi:hypothetical protein